MKKGRPTLTLTHRLWHIFFFYDAVNITDYTPPRQSTGERRIENDLRRRPRRLINILSQNLPGETE